MAFIPPEFPIQKSLLILVWSEVYSNQNLFPMWIGIGDWDGGGIGDSDLESEIGIEDWL